VNGSSSGKAGLASTAEEIGELMQKSSIDKAQLRR